MSQLRQKISFLWNLASENRRQFLFLISATLSLNVIAALSEGLSFGFILFALSSLSSENHHLQFGLSELLSDFSSYQTFIILLTAGVFLQIVRGVLSFLSVLYSSRLSTKLEAVILKKIYHQIFRLSFPCVSRYKIGELAEYTSNAAKIIILLGALNQFLIAFFTVCILAVLMVMISPVLTACVFGFFITGILLQKTLLKTLVKASHKVSEFSVHMAKYGIQSLNGIRTIYTFNRQDSTTHKIKRTIEANALASLRLNAISNSMTPLNESIGIIIVGLCLIIGPYLLTLEEGSMMSYLLTFVTTMYRFSTRAQQVVTGASTMASTLGPLSRIQELLQDKDKEFLPLSGRTLKSTQHLIEFCNVSLQYTPDRPPALRDVSFTIQPGEITALVGQSGAGKSSILDLILRLYSPTSGEILLDDIPLKEYSLASWLKCLGVVSQDTFIFNESIAENIRFGTSVSWETIKEAAKLAGADGFIEKLPHGYHTVVGERGYRLSGGERQRLALARALVRRPQILILDEATSNLDSHSEWLIQQALENLQHEQTVIVVAHRLSTIAKADQIIVLDEGQILELGTHNELLEKGGMYSYLWKIQSREELLTV